MMKFSIQGRNLVEKLRQDQALIVHRFSGTFSSFWSFQKTTFATSE